MCDWSIFHSSCGIGECIGIAQIFMYFVSCQFVHFFPFDSTKFQFTEACISFYGKSLQIDSLIFRSKFLMPFSTVGNLVKSTAKSDRRNVRAVHERICLNC